MPRHAAITMRELGATLAMLSLYVLILLAPLHQAAGLQRDLAGLGYETLAAWSVCEPLAAEDNGDPLGIPAIKCPAAGLGKPGFAAPLPAAVHLVPPSLADIVAYARHGAPDIWRLPEHFGQSRAPPVPV